MKDSYYTVQPGDTLQTIAEGLQTEPSELIRANPQIIALAPNLLLLAPQRDPHPQELESQIMALVNAHRYHEGLNPLTPNPDLARIARTKSEDMYRNGYFGHISPTFGSPFDMLRRFGIRFTAAAENLARGQIDAQDVVGAWMSSPLHRANMLNPVFTEAGAGYVNHGVPYYTLLLMRP